MSVNASLAQFRCDPGSVTPSVDPATEFLRRACPPDPEADSPRSAGQVLERSPGLALTDLHVAAACADPGAVTAHLHGHRSRASLRGGPYGWPPLLYLVYARHEPAPAGAAVAATAELLLQAGADPNAGFLLRDLPTPYTAVTGALARRDGDDLVELLLRAGADPNDAQGLYDRMFTADDRHLELLFAHGLGDGDGGPWRRRMGSLAASPGALLRAQLAWAITHGYAARVTLLADHGVDLDSPLSTYGVDGMTPYQAALSSGQREVASLLRDAGADGAASPEHLLLDAVLAPDAAGAGRLTAHAPDLLRQVLRHRPGLVPWAASLRRPGAVRLAVELGWDVSALARTDIPSDQRWETALHQAAADGDTELARMLVALGADTSVRDARFGSTPLQWAGHFGHSGTAGFLRSIGAPA